MLYEHYRDAQEYFRFGRTVSKGHFHRAIELVYCIEAPKPAYIDGVEMTVEPGELLFVSPFSTHIFPRVLEHRSLCVVLPLECTDVLEKVSGGKSYDTQIFHDKELCKDIYEVLLKLQNLENPLARKGIYYYVLGKISEVGEISTDSKKRDNAFAIGVLNYLEKHYSEQLSLEKVAADLGYSRCYFSALFKKVFCKGFCDYLSMLRVRKSLLLIETQPVATVAFSVGFGSVQNYYLNFKRIMGMTPGEYLSSKE